MELVIRRMSPELAGDYFDFFDHRAFSDGSPYYPCYCNAFQLTKEQIGTELFDRAEANGGGKEGWRTALRSSAERMVAEGTIRGYLAYDGEIAVGWCNANDKRNYARVGEFSLDDIPDEEAEDAPEGGDGPRIKSIVCFEIAPPYRGRGIAAALLERVCQDAAADGYDVVEAYPVVRDTYETLDYTGPVGLYEKAGFIRAARQGKGLVMQKKLKE